MQPIKPLSKELVCSALVFLVAAVALVICGWWLNDRTSGKIDLSSESVAMIPSSTTEGGSSTDQWRHARISHPNSAAGGEKFFQQLGVTIEEWNATREINAREQEGEYILLLERPTTLRLISHDFKEITSVRSRLRSKADNEIFRDLGLTLDQIGKIRTHLSKIHTASLQAGIAIQQLLRSRYDFDERIKQLLSEHDYHRYREYERSKSAIDELEHVSMFFTEQKVEMDSRSRDVILRLIRENNAYSKIMSHGPYDSIPQVRVGSKEVLSQLNSRTEQLATNAAELLKHASSLKLANPLINGLREYYSNRISANKKLMKAIGQRELSSTLIDPVR